MATTIPFVRDIEFDYGTCDQLSPSIRRVIAKNPSAFTYTGTGTYIIGRGRVAVIDPGPRDQQHVDAILEATRGEQITTILITHTHNDHSPAVELLLKDCDARTYGFGPHGAGKNTEDEVVVEEGGDMTFSPDEYVRHGDVIGDGDWEVECVYTPGHTSNHICYRLASEGVLFTGDHVMGWSTSVISPPDGDMASYMKSLELLLEHNDEIYWPTHGPAITQPQTHVQAFVAHRLEREDQIIAQLKQRRHHIADMVPIMYEDVDQRLHPAAARSVYAAMLYMVEKEVIRCEGDPSLTAPFYLN